MTAEMTAGRKLSMLVPVALAAAALTGGPAQADGLPVLGIDVGSEGVAAPGAPVRYVTVPLGARTLVEQTATRGGSLLGSARLDGNFTVPAVAYDGSASGLSRDGRRLVLIEPRRSFPRATTTFAVLDAKRLRLLEVVVLHGDFSFDAVSPAGRWMYLIQYTSPQDPSRYAVRAYDLATRRLQAAPVVDPRARDEAMRGSPITRRMSAGGRWAYTLYDGGGGTPFVHALDTWSRVARCIDLPMLAGRQDLFRLRMTLGGSGGGHPQLTVGARGERLALVDTRTFAASLPSVPSVQRRGSGATRSIVVIAGGLAALAVTGLGLAAAVVRRRRRPLVPAQHSEIAL